MENSPNSPPSNAPRSDGPPRTPVRETTDEDNKLAAQVSPPYWTHHRSASQISERSIDRPSPITLSDNTEPDSRTHGSLWAKSINIEDYVIVKGNLVGIAGAGSYVVWNCKVQTLDGGPMIIRKRYSEFDELREELVKAFPQSTEHSLPLLPPKSAIYKFRPKFLERRRQGLSYFLNCVMLNPEYASSEIVKDFIFT